LQEVPAAQLASLLRVRKKDLPASALIVVWEWNEDALTEEARRILESFSSHPDVTDIRLENPGLEATRKPEVLRERVSMLSTDERRVLELLAAAHTPVGLDELLRAMGGEDVATIVLLDRLANRGFIEVDPETGRHRLAVPGLEGVLLSGMDEVVRNDRHRAWRDVLAAGRDDHPQKLHHALALGDAAFVARVAPNIVESLRTSRGFEEALRMTDAALELVQGLADTVATSRLLRIKGNLLNDLGRYREALGVAEEVYALAAPDEPMAVKTVKHWLVTGLIHQNLGDRAEAERRFERCLKEAMRFADDVPRSYAMRAHVLLGVEALRRGDPATARGHFEEGLSFAESRGWRRAEILRNLAVVHHREGDAEGAVRLLGEARGHYREEGNPEGEYAAWLEEGNLALERDDFAAAESAYARAEEIAKARDDDLLFASVWNNQGVLGRRRGDLGRSLERLQRALEVFRPLGNWIDLAECLKQNAITEAEVGRFDAAASKIAEIRAMIPKLASAGEKAAEAEKTLCALRDGIGEAAEDVAVARKRLTALYARLPKSLQISFEDRHDYKKWGHP
jgi:tetratricopeptide (TPR) repeat protein